MPLSRTSRSLTMPMRRTTNSSILLPSLKPEILQLRSTRLSPGFADALGPHPQGLEGVPSLLRRVLRSQGAQHLRRHSLEDDAQSFTIVAVVDDGAMLD